jgi:type III pantothenate kinase
MNVVLDWGNSSVKVGWFVGETLQQTAHFNSIADLRDYVTGQQPQNIIVSSTNRPATELQTALTNWQSAYWLTMTSSLAVPIGNAYDTPQTLGTDRLAAAVGATTLFWGKPCLIFDLGTCITADFLDAQPTFRGGLISPGLQMRFRAMHNQTARLPMIERPEWQAVSIDTWPTETATNTHQAMLSGVLNGILFELNGLIDRYRQQYPNVQVLLCGGDAPVFESRLKGPIFAVPDLVLRGLNRILEHNVR